MIVEGSQVVYVGDDPATGVGATGRALSTSGRAVHVQWGSGERAGMLDLVDADDLVPSQQTVAASVAEEFADSLTVQSQQHLEVRAAYDEGGADGVLNALAETGHLAVLAEYAEEAYGQVHARLRQDLGFAQVLAGLDESESEILLSRVSAVLLADRIATEDD